MVAGLVQLVGAVLVILGAAQLTGPWALIAGGAALAVLAEVHAARGRRARAGDGR